MNAIDFGTFTGTSAGAVLEEKWNYPAIGYNASDGTFYVDSSPVDNLTIVPFAVRECVEVTAGDGSIHRYPPRTRRTDRVEGESSTRLQMVCMIGDELYIFGMRSYTARASFMNPAKGAWHNEVLGEGIWLRLVRQINEVKASHSVQAPPFCWRLALAAGPSVKMVSGANNKQSTSAHPIVLTGDFEFVGADMAQANAKLYIEESLDEWRAEWGKAAVEAPAENVAAEPVGVVEDEIPF